MIDQPQHTASAGNQLSSRDQLQTPDRTNPNWARVGWRDTRPGSEVDLTRQSVNFGIGEVNNAKGRDVGGRAAFRLVDGNIYYIEAGMVICLSETIEHGQALGGFLTEAPHVTIGEPVAITTRDTQGTTHTFTSPSAVEEVAVELPQRVAITPGETQPNTGNIFTMAEDTLENAGLNVSAILAENWEAIGGNTAYLNPAP